MLIAQPWVFLHRMDLRAVRVGVAKVVNHSGTKQKTGEHGGRSETIVDDLIPSITP